MSGLLEAPKLLDMRLMFRKLFRYKGNMSRGYGWRLCHSDNWRPYRFQPKLFKYLQPV